jgi:Kdo2-lipid IVA lauroyltransferase/acyltransferase
MYECGGVSTTASIRRSAYNPHSMRVPRPLFLFGRWLGHGLTRLVIALVRILPARASFALGAWLGATAYALMPRWQETAQRNLQIFYKDEPLGADTSVVRQQRIAIGREAARGLGWHVIEFIRMGWLPVQKSLAMVVETEGLEHLRGALAQGRGVIVVGMHYGNWEMPGEYLAQHFPPTYAVGKEQRDEFFTKIAFPWRAKYGIRNIMAGNKANSAILRALKEGAILGLLSDQNGGRTGTFAPFAGTIASTVAGPAALGLRTGAPVVLVYCRRIAPGQLRLVFTPPVSKEGIAGVDPVTGKATPEAIVEMLTRINADIEAVIRADPTQWLWGHKRWKTRPEGEPGLY